MDFSSLLSKEIEKKRKLAGETKKNKKIRAEDDVKDTETDTLRTAATSEKITSDENSRQVYTPEETVLINSISDEQLDSKLEQLDESCDADSTKLDKIKKLEVLLRLQKKNEVYRIQLEKEAETDRDIRLEDITSVDARDKLHTQVRMYIKYMVKEWENDVQMKRVSFSNIESDEEREEEQISVATQSTMLLDTKKDLVRLLYKLRTQKLTDSMLTSLCTIMYYLQNRDYRRANESYMKLSIGNVAWPIGVKGVGIHERSAALKITGENKQNSANIMLDDKTRRWITAVKRLISFAERKWPT
ncbi:uncharacterized protein AC631_03226 [Debaryomyces fabryi]|uniref:Pre-mRNA-splicing factor 18 n=1 Tax=Debaryomyces fabryi TaxID=58627 RepID=A0A0V1PYM2_9ASCO|nr:uncharacterized protein AC631_03226 [Debaryomyces fabryi]KSA01039.1 hypothetical protein AC631_03226 [Debaryomyces fabryi]CUM51050.1 unnamed protein product [Debaryomyces fabryi]